MFVAGVAMDTGVMMTVWASLLSIGNSAQVGGVDHSAAGHSLSGGLLRGRNIWVKVITVLSHPSIMRPSIVRSSAV